MLANKLSLPELFPPTCLGKGHTVCCGELPRRSPTSHDFADEGRVHGKLGSVEERQTNRDDLQAAFINSNSRKKGARMLVPEGSLRAPLMSRKLHGPRESSGWPHLQKADERGSGQRRRKRRTQETLRRENSGMGFHHRTPLRSNQCLFGGIQTGAHRVVEKHFLHL